MAEFEKIKTEEELAVQLKEEIETFLKEMDLVRRVARTIPSANYTKFDPLLFLLWRNK